MKQNIQQTALQRALQPVARAIPSGLKQFYMAAGEEETAVGGQVEVEAASYTRFKEQQAKKRARLAAISADDLATPEQLDDMMAFGSSAVSSSGYDAGSSTAIVPLRVRTQTVEEPPSGDLRGLPWRLGHRRTDSSTSTESVVSATSGVSTATTVATPKQPAKKPPDLNVLLEVAEGRRRDWNRSDSDDKVQLSMEISDLIYQIGVLTNSVEYHKPAVARAYIKAKKRLIEIMEMPV